MKSLIKKQKTILFKRMKLNNANSKFKSTLFNDIMAETLKKQVFYTCEKESSFSQITAKKPLVEHRFQRGKFTARTFCSHDQIPNLGNYHVMSKEFFCWTYIYTFRSYSSFWQWMLIFRHRDGLAYLSSFWKPALYFRLLSLKSSLGLSLKNAQRTRRKRCFRPARSVMS